MSVISSSSVARETPEGAGAEREEPEVKSLRRLVTCLPAPRAMALVDVSNARVGADGLVYCPDGLSDWGRQWVRRSGRLQWRWRTRSRGRELWLPLQPVGAAGQRRRHLPVVRSRTSARWV